jgi:hypothetical protein
VSTPLVLSLTCISFSHLSQKKIVFFMVASFRQFFPQFAGEFWVRAVELAEIWQLGCVIVAVGGYGEGAEELADDRGWVG